MREPEVDQQPLADKVLGLARLALGIGQLPLAADCRLAQHPLALLHDGYVNNPPSHIISQRVFVMVYAILTDILLVFHIVEEPESTRTGDRQHAKAAPRNRTFAFHRVGLSLAGHISRSAGRLTAERRSAAGRQRRRRFGEVHAAGIRIGGRNQAADVFGHGVGIVRAVVWLIRMCAVLEMRRNVCERLELCEILEENTVFL